MKAPCFSSRSVFVVAGSLLTLLLIVNVWYSTPKESAGSREEISGRELFVPAPHARSVSGTTTEAFSIGNDGAEMRVSHAPRSASEEVSVFERFERWVTDYSDASSAEERNALEEEGRILAAERREELKSLIRDDPERALSLAVSYRDRQTLPVSIVALLEERVGGRGEFDVLGASPMEGGDSSVCTIIRFARMDGRSYDAYVYGRREAQGFETDVAMHGIAIDRAFAVQEMPVRRMEFGEPIERERVLTGWPTGDGEPDPRLIGPGEAPESVTDGVAAYESPEGVRIPYMADYAGDLESDFLAVESIGNRAYETLGEKTILTILVTFPDLAGTSGDEGEGEATEPVARFPATRQEGFAVLHDVNESFLHSSYRQMRFSAMHVTAPGDNYVMPEESEYYLEPQTVEDEEGNEVELDGEIILLEHARELAREDGYLVDYDFVVVVFGNIGFEWAGLGRVGAKGAWVQGNLSPSTTAHEIGHNFGLFHARYWEPLGTGGTYPIEEARSFEYGNVFDVMGAAGSLFPYNQFNSNFKNYIGWLPGAAIHHVPATESADVYRLHRLDGGAPLEPGRRKHALRVEVAAPDTFPNIPVNDYWIEFRQSFQVGERATNGVMVLWGDERASALSNHLLNMNPMLTEPDGMPISRVDTPLAIGETFVDPFNEVVITPVGRGGSSPHEFVDVVVTRGTLEVAIVEPEVEFSFPNPEGIIEIPGNRSLNLIASAHATGSPIDRVEYVVDGESIGIAAAVNDLYYTTLDVGALDFGLHTINAHVWNQAGNEVRSGTVLIDVIPPGFPPVLGASATILAIGDPVEFSVALESDVFPVDFVEFYVDGESIGGSDSAPLTIIWTPDRAGDFDVWAVVRYDETETVQTNVVNVRVNESDLIVPSVVYSWSNRDSGTGADLYGITFSGDRFVAVGASGVVIASADARTWAERDSGVEVTLRSVAYGQTSGGNGLYVAVGDGGTILESSDSENWSQAVSQTSMNIRGVSYDQGVFVAVGENGRIQWRDHEGTWRLRLISDFTDLQSTGFMQGRFYAVGNNGVIVSSETGESWQEHISQAGQDLNGIAFGDNRVLVVGRESAANREVISVSIDALTWVRRHHGLDRSFNSVVFGNDVFLVAGSNGYLATSAHDAHLALNPSGVTVDFNDAVFGAGTFVAVGRNGVIVESSESHSGFDAWVGRSFSIDEVNNPALVAPEADYGGWGMPNILRYVLGLDARAPTGPNIPSPSIVPSDSGDEEYLALSYAYRLEAEGLTLVPQVSADLIEWQSLGEEYVFEDSETDRFRHITVRDPEPLTPDGNPRFMRLKLEWNE